ncbi:recombination protein NinG [Pedobacter sp. Leaf176]|uniref:recombination protein NinG n=1 Tax=Pedobacter sp. Leaf176 TaxID=1736286 RepID=UPI000AD917BE|nr:recombination protein NinG [Pedobacter sp. Leaf176]
MVYFEKSQPAPNCLELEKAKANGDYKCLNVLEKIKDDFKNKCYICEYKEPIAINVEHFLPHEGNKELKFNWDNLFWSCAHCNNIKLANYTNILNCTVANHFVGIKLKYLFKPFPYEKVVIEELVNTPEVIQTKQLLEAVYNGTTKLKTIEAANLRNRLLDEIKDFQHYLCEYFKDTNSVEDKEYFLIKIRGHLNRGSNFTAFKRWIVIENETLYKTFSMHLD